MTTTASGAALRGPTRRPSTLSALLLLAVLGGCAAATGSVEREDPFTRAPVDESKIRLHVQNNNFSDARLYALTLGIRTNLGVVGGKQQAVFSIPWDYSEPLSIEIDLLAGPKCTTPTLEVEPGETLDLLIEAVFSRTRPCG